MSLVFAAVTPHPPLLISTIGKEATQQLNATKEAFASLEQDLYVSKPQIIIVISPHEGLYENAFVVNAHPQFIGSYKNFGDVTTIDNWIGAPDFAAKIGHASNVNGFPLRLVSEENLSHGASVPLHFLLSHLKEVKILPLGFSNLSPKEHLDCGELLKEVIFSTDKRVAVIASGDLSHCLSPNAPGGQKEAGKKFDESLIQMLETRNTIGITQMDKLLIDEAKECGYRSLLILLGILKNIDYTFKRYSYEHPFGIGYLTGNFIF